MRSCQLGQNCVITRISNSFVPLLTKAFNWTQRTNSNVLKFKKRDDNVTFWFIPTSETTKKLSESEIQTFLKMRNKQLYRAFDTFNQNYGLFVWPKVLQDLYAGNLFMSNLFENLHLPSCIGHCHETGMMVLTNIFDVKFFRFDGESVDGRDWGWKIWWND